MGAIANGAFPGLLDPLRWMLELPSLASSGRPYKRRGEGTVCCRSLQTALGSGDPFERFVAKPTKWPASALRPEYTKKPAQICLPLKPSEAT
jgi:hypothetical protein